jgi:solute carrier family 13 (sodium-dependent dicarboxylate transporter), member 2/3/5
MLIDWIKKLAGPAVGFILYLLVNNSTSDPIMAKMAGVAGWIAVWWITEAISLFFTALLPLFLFPLLGIMDMREVAPLYTNEIIFLFVGGFLIAFAIEKWELHKRIAFSIINSTGTTPSRILFGIMLSSYILSMWISNIATTMMLIPAVLAVATQFEVSGINTSKKIATALLLGLAYAASIGGTATVIGTAPNMIFMAFYNNAFPDFPQISFTKWIMFGLPISATFFIVAYLLINRLFFKNLEGNLPDADECKKAYNALGKMKFEEKALIILFSITVLLWFFRADIAIDQFVIRGWSNFFPEATYITDSTVAMLMAGVLFLFPSKDGGQLLGWEEAKKIPLGIIFLFGGGFAIARGITTSGLSDWIAQNMVGIDLLHPVILVIILCTFMTFFTELTSNTASTYLILPLLLSVSVNIDVHPVLLMTPVVFSASFAFMLPVATPPNTVVFASEQVKIKDMMRTGIYLNLIGVILITLFIFLIGEYIFVF